MSEPSPAVLAVTLGDPCGIGPEILVKALARSDLDPSSVLLVVGDARVIEAEARRQGVHLDLARFPGSDASGRGKRPTAGAVAALLDSSNLDPATLVPGRPDRAGAAASLLYVQRAAELALAGVADGIVTLPVSKEAIRAAEPNFTGHTEFLRDLAGVPETVMLFCSGELRLALATTHVALAQVPRLITVAGIRQSLAILREGLVESFALPAPRIAVAALNPHGGEGGSFGDEEARVLAPAIAEARAQGIDASGPYPADTLFVRLREGEFDAALALYHDQAMIPVKLAGVGRAVNVTLGLPFVRTSPAHGTAWDIAGKGRASEESLVGAIRLAARLVLARNARARRERGGAR